MHLPLPLVDLVPGGVCRCVAGWVERGIPSHTHSCPQRASPEPAVPASGFLGSGVSCWAAGVAVGRGERMLVQDTEVRMSQGEVIRRVLRTNLPMALRVRPSKALEMLLMEPPQEGRAAVWRARRLVRAIALMWKRVPWRVEAGAGPQGAEGLEQEGFWQPQPRGPQRGVGRVAGGRAVGQPLSVKKRL